MLQKSEKISQFRSNQLENWGEDKKWVEKLSPQNRSVWKCHVRKLLTCEEFYELLF